MHIYIYVYIMYNKTNNNITYDMYDITCMSILH